MNVFKATLDTRHQNGVIGTVTQFDNATLELQVVTDGVIDEAWGNPRFELIAMKRDANEVREVDQDRFTILSKEEHRVQIELKEQFLTCRGTVKMQLVIKEGSRLSTTLFYLVIGQSLDHDIVASYRDAKVLDDLDSLNQQAYDDLAFREQRYEEMEDSFTELNGKMNANEAERNKAEITRQKTFDINEAHRTRTFNNKVEEQGVAFSNAQTQRDESFIESQQNMSQEFETSQRERENAFNELQKSNQKTFETNEQKRQTTFAQSQSANKQTFTQNETERQHIFESNESDRQVSESQRVQNESERVQAESQRADAEVIRQQKMTEFEEKATQLSEDLDSQVARVGEFVSANEEKLLGPHDKTDYMGNAHKSVKDANDANVEYILGEVNTVHYEGQHITATDTIEKQVRSAILSGNTLVNCVDSSLITVSTNAKRTGDIITIDNTTSYSRFNIHNNQPLMPFNTDKTYIMILSNINGDTNGLNMDCYGRSYSLINNKYFIFKLNAIDGSNRMLWVQKHPNQNATTDTVSFRVSIFEYQDGMENWNIPYFTGMQSVKMPVLTTTGKNTWNTNKMIISIDDGLKNVQCFANSIKLTNSSQSWKGFVVKNDQSLKYLSFNASASEVNDITKYIRVSSDGTQVGRYDLTKGRIVVQLPENSQQIKIQALSTNGNDVEFEFIDIQLEKESFTSYEPYKTNILTVNEDVELRGIDDIKDTLDLATGELIQRIDKVVLDGGEDKDFKKGYWDKENTVTFYLIFDETATQSGRLKFLCNELKFNNNFYDVDEECILYTSNVDGTVALYIRLLRSHLENVSVEGLKSYLSKTPIVVFRQCIKPVIKTVDLSDNHVYSYKDVTHYDCSSAEGSLVPTLSIDVPTNLPAVVARQRVTIQELEKENVALKNEIEETANSSVNGDLELMSSQFELDFRLFEIEMNLDMPMMAMMRGVKSIAMTVYQQAKTLILAGKYEREGMEYKLNRYKEAGRITVEEYEELIALMDARELVD